MSAGAALPPGFVGVVSEDSFAVEGEYRHTTFGLQREVGITLVRQTFDWAAIERTPGTYDFSWHDVYVGDAARHGISILPILFNPPAFRSSAPKKAKGDGIALKRGTYPPKRYGDLGDFGAVLVRRYGPGGSYWAEHPEIPALPIRAWQIWNEPNLKAYWPAGPNPKAYTQLLKASAAPIKAADPSAEIVTAGMPESKIGIPLDRFVKGMYKAGAKSHFDTLAINPYAGNAAKLVARVAMVRKLMDKQRDRSAGIRITEMGWSDKGPKSEFRVGSKKQAANVAATVKALAKVRKRMKLRGIVYFNWRDAPPYAGGKDFWGLHTGLLGEDGKPKDSLGALKDALGGL